MSILAICACNTVNSYNLTKPLCNLWIIDHVSMQVTRSENGRRWKDWALSRFSRSNMIAVWHTWMQRWTPCQLTAAWRHQRLGNESSGSLMPSSVKTYCSNKRWSILPTMHWSSTEPKTSTSICQWFHSWSVKISLIIVTPYYWTEVNWVY